jgi:hypothetical protein
MERSRPVVAYVAVSGHSYTDERDAEQSLPHYCAFLLDANDRVFAAVHLVCDNDPTAMELASELTIPCCAIEVWQSARMVGRLTGGEPSPADGRAPK